MTTGENRFEQWFSKGFLSRLILIAALLGVWLLCDSLLALAIVKIGYAKPEEFFVTSLRASAHPALGDVPELRTSPSRPARRYSGYLDRFQADGLLGARLVPNFLIIMPSTRRNPAEPTDGAGKIFWFMTDEYGFPLVARVGHHYQLRKSADVFRVIVLGGSTVEGIGVDSPLESLPSKLQLLLEHEFSQSSKQVEVINGGISHFASDQEYLLLIADLVRFEPDLVIAYDGWNDAQLLPGTIAGAPRTRPYRTESQEDNADRVNATFSPSGSLDLFATLSAGRAIQWLRHFATFRVLHYSIDRFIGALHGGNDRAPRDQPYQPGQSIEAAQIYMENRERMLFIAKQKGFRFASFLQPIMGIDGKTYTPIEAQYARPARDIVKQQREIFYQTVRPLLGKFASTNEVSGSTCVADLSSRFAGVSATVYADTGHLLEKGNELIAQHILAELKRCNLLPQVQARK